MRRAGAPDAAEENKTMRNLLSAFALLAAFSAAAQAGDMKPIHAEPIDLGTFKGSAYYTAEKDGLKVVATLAPEQALAPVRVSAVLAPEQSISVAVPGPVGGREASVSFSRRGDKIVVARSEQPGY
jgi:hypothetical protein